MLKLSRFLMASFLLSTGSLFAYFHPCPGEWAVTGEFIYLYPSLDDTYFVIDSATIGTTEGTKKNNDFDFKPGFRVGAAYGFCDCNWEFRADYERLRGTQSRTVDGPFLAGTVGTPAILTTFAAFAGSATSDLDLLYQRVNGIVANKVWSCCGFDIFFDGGLEWAYLRLNEQVDYLDGVGNLGEVNLKSKVWGIGPQFGMEFDYKLCEFATFGSGTLTFVASTTGSLLAAKTETDFFDAINGVLNFDVSNEDTWRIVPAFHARVGINYLTCFSCFVASLELGYEFNTYIRGLTRTEFVSETAIGLSSTNYYNFDTQGLYASATIGF